MPMFAWFSLSLRVIGAWTIVNSVSYFVICFNTYQGFDAGTFKPIAYFNQGIAHLVVGLLLVKLAPFFVSLVYRELRKSEPKEETSIDR